MYKRYQFLAKGKATTRGKVPDSLPRNNAVAELCFGKFIIVNRCDLQSNYQHHHQCDLDVKRSKSAFCTSTQY
jgi:hypothetical protein